MMKVHEVAFAADISITSNPNILKPPFSTYVKHHLTNCCQEFLEIQCLVRRVTHDTGAVLIIICHWPSRSLEGGSLTSCKCKLAR